MKHYPPLALLRSAAVLADQPKALLTEEALVVELQARITRRGETSRVAHQIGVSQGTVSNILAGTSPIGDKVAEALGYRRRIFFEPID
jgi:uncharacterized protein (UPF0210 family)